MDSKDIAIRLQQLVNWLKGKSGSGQVPPPELCQVLEAQNGHIVEAYGMAQEANEGTKGLLARLMALEKRLGMLAQASHNPNVRGMVGGGAGNPDVMRDGGSGAEPPTGGGGGGS